jgi:hypothetical protein
MGDLQRKYQKAPCGWREADIAAVMARLIREQRVAVSVGGKQLGAGDEHAIVRCLRSDADKATVKKREKIEASTLASVQHLMKDFAETNQVPGDEDGIVAFAKEHLKEASDTCRDLLAERYSRRSYPGKDKVAEGKKLVDSLLEGAKDPVLFCMSLANRATQGDLLDFAEDLGRIRFFFHSQARIYDESRDVIAKLRTEGIYIEGDTAVQDAIAKIEGVLDMDEPYDRIKDLGPLNKTVLSALKSAADVKRDDLLRSIEDSLSQVKRYAEDEGKGFESDVRPIVAEAERACTAKRNNANRTTDASQLDAQLSQLKTWEGQQYPKIDDAVAYARKRKLESEIGHTVQGGGQPAPAPKPPRVKSIPRSRACPTKTLHSKEEVDEYVDDLRARLLKALEDNDAVRLGD